MGKALPLASSPRRGSGWLALQAAIFLAGAAILAALLFAPRLGLDLLWNGLIPAAPLLLVLFPGFWRNVCPLSSVALLPRKLGWSSGMRIRRAAQARVALAGALLLLALVSARRVSFDTSAAASAILLAGAATTAFVAGLLFESKSGWCAGLCPLRAVETLYGGRSAATFDNAHCGSCAYCATPCPDSAPVQLARGSSRAESATRILMVGGFPGFIVGWFLVPDARAGFDAAHALRAFALPLLACAASAVLYLAIRARTPEASREGLARGFALASVTIYYLFRLPALFGWAVFEGDGVAADLRGVLPAWTPWLLRALVLALGIAAWRGLREARAWQRRPEPAPRSRDRLAV